MIRQFVAMPLGSGYSAEEQITGAAEHVAATTDLDTPIEVGGNDELIFDGGSFVADARGCRVLRLPRGADPLGDNRIDPVLRAAVADSRAADSVDPRRLEVDVPEDLPPVRADRRRLTQMSEESDGTWTVSSAPATRPANPTRVMATLSRTEPQNRLGVLSPVCTTNGSEPR